MFRKLRFLALIGGGVLLAAVRALASETGVPVYIQVRAVINPGINGGGIGFNINAQDAQGVQASQPSLGGGGGGPGATVLTNVALYRLQPGKASTLQLNGYNIATHTIQVLGGSGSAIEMRPASSSPGDFLPTMRLSGSGSSASYEIRLLDGGQVQRAALGAAVPLANESVLWRVSLGANKEGTSAGWLSLMSQGWQGDWSNLYTPSALVAPDNATGTKYWTNGSTLWQAISEEGFVQVEPTSSTSYTIKSYIRTNATGSAFPYGVVGGAVPITTHTVQKHPSFDKGLKIATVWAGDASTERVTELKTDGATWTVGSSVRVVAGSVDANAVVVDECTGPTLSSPGSTATRDTSISQLAASGTAGAVQETQQLFPWGPETTSTTGAPSGSAPRTLNVAYGTTGQTGAWARPTNISTNVGGWVRYEYYGNFDDFGQVYREFRPFQDAPASGNTDPTQGDVTTYEYVADLTGYKRLPASRVRRINDVVVGKTLWSYSWPSVSLGSGITGYLVETTQDSYANASTSITTVAKAFRGDVSIGPFGLRLGGFPYSSTSADGSKTSHAYFLGEFGWGTSTDPDFKSVTISGTTVSTGADYVTSWEGRTIDGLYVVPGKSMAQISVTDRYGRLRRTEVKVYFGSGNWELCGKSDYTLNDAGQCTQVTGMGGQILSTATYLGAFLMSSTDASGVETTYQYYDDGRLKFATKKGAAAYDGNPAQADLVTKYEYNAMGQVLKTTVGCDPTGATTPETLVSEASYDAAGRMTGTKAPGLNWTTYTYEAGDQVTSVTYPNGSWTTTSYYDDGRVKNVTGSATAAQYWGYWIYGGQINAQRTLVEGGVWTNYGYDWLGRQLEQWRPTYGAPANYIYYDYNNKGQLWRVRRPALADVLMEYDQFGQEIRTGIDRNGNGALDGGGTDRISERENKVVLRNGAYWAESHEWVYDTDYSTHSIGGYSYSKLTGLSSTRLSQSETVDANGNITSSWTDVDRGNKLVTQTSSSASSSQNAWVRIHNGLPVQSNSSTGVYSQTYYDALFRRWKTRERSGGWSSTGYHPGTNLVSTQWDASNTVVARYYYDGAGQVTEAVNALNRSTRTSYTSRGEVWRMWGDVPNPVEYEYDAWGQMKYMRTYRDTGVSWTGTTWPTSPGAADTTTWDYDHDSRMLKSKIDAAGRAVAYEYNQAQQVTKRISPRHIDGNSGLDFIRVSYAYNDSGAPTGIDYNDSTPDVGYTYLRSGLVDTVTDVTGTRNFDYRSQDGQLAFEQMDSFYKNRRISRDYDTTAGVVGRYNRLILGDSSNGWSEGHTYYGYIDNRVTWIDNYTPSVGSNRGYNIGYAPNSDLLQQVWQSEAQYSHWRQYEANRNVIQHVENWEGGTMRAKFNYARNAAGQVTAVTKTGQIYGIYGTGHGVHTRYGYNDRGELTSENSFLANPGDPINPWSDIGSVYSRAQTLVYDLQGNRISSTKGAHTTSYERNNLNQIIARTNPGSLTATGAADAGQLVQVNGSNANRQGEYFQQDISVDNSSSPAYQPVRATVGSDLETAQAAITSAYVPRSSEGIGYDEEGNLTSDDRWNYKYDAENRLVEMETGAGAVAAGTPAQRLTFTYDYMGRRVSKVVQNYEVHGFLGQYFDQENLTARHHVRTDSQIWFGLGSNFPGAGQNPDGFSTYWSGYLFAQTTGNHRFRFTVDDTFRMWVNGQLVTKSWHYQGATPYESGDVHLTVGSPVFIQIEFGQGGGGADAKLEWLQPGLGWLGIPATSMRSSRLDGTGSWRTVTDLKFMYDGWNLVGEYDNANNNSVLRSYTWGLDLSSTSQGAGGIGGLLKIDEGNQTYLPAYDELGHVHGLVRASDNALVATYEYNAFGEIVRQSGEYAARNPLGWATKYTDRETGLVYFGLRYYSPNLGRFINRDPIAEDGGVNLQAFCGNDPINCWEYLGMDWVPTADGRWRDTISGEVRDTTPAQDAMLSASRFDADIDDGYWQLGHDQSSLFAEDMRNQEWLDRSFESSWEASNADSQLQHHLDRQNAAIAASLAAGRAVQVNYSDGRTELRGPDGAILTGRVVIASDGSRQAELCDPAIAAMWQGGAQSLLAGNSQAGDAYVVGAAETTSTAATPGGPFGQTLPTTCVATALQNYLWLQGDKVPTEKQAVASVASALGIKPAEYERSGAYGTAPYAAFTQYGYAFDVKLAGGDGTGNFTYSDVSPILGNGVSGLMTFRRTNGTAHSIAFQVSGEMISVYNGGGRVKSVPKNESKGPLTDVAPIKNFFDNMKVFEIVLPKRSSTNKASDGGKSKKKS